MKTLALYTPYELVAGGGERYLLSVADAFRDEFRVFLVTPELQSADRIRRLGEQLGVETDQLIPITIEKARACAPFSLAIVLGNEALPAIAGLGQRNIFICQFPFPFDQDEATRRLPNIATYECVVVYSEYVEKHLRGHLDQMSAPQLPIHVIHPPVSALSVDSLFVRRKRMAILSVGRFFTGGHSKRQDELISTFRRLCADHHVSLHLAGALHAVAPHLAMFEKCRELAHGLPVTFYPDASRAKLAWLYRSADCYWHGAGLGADRAAEPEKFEHFGISVVEAMAAGCIPFVLDHGGPASIVTSGRDGWVYNSPEELLELTSRFITSTSLLGRHTMRRAARRRARQFRSEAFTHEWRKLQLKRATR
jgi:glycosyltransferase involved in cell wall biosynthesis